MREDTEWVIDGEELQAWEAEMERLRREMDQAYGQDYELLVKIGEIRDRGLSRNPGEGLRFAIITEDEGKQLKEINSEAASVTKRMGVLMKQATAHLARYPRPKPRPRGI